MCFIAADYLSYQRRQGGRLAGGLAHYKSCPVNPGGRADERISSQHRAGRIGDTHTHTQSPTGGDIEEQIEKAVKHYAVCDWLIRSDR